MTAAVQFDQSNAAGAIFGTAAAQTFYFVDAAAPNSSEGTLQIGGSAPGVATMNTGWVLGTAHASNEYSALVYNSISAATHWSTTVGPPATPGSTSCFRTTTTLHGQFPAGSWAMKLAAIMTVGGTSGNANYRMRVFRSTSPTGAGATEVTTSTIAFTTFAIATLTQQNTTATWSAPKFFLNNEYLFFSIYLEIVAGAVSPVGATAQMVQDGTNTVITTTAFTPSILQSDHTVCFFFRSTTNTASFAGIYQLANNVGDGSLGAIIALGTDGKTLGFSPPNISPATITGVVVDLNKWYFAALVISKGGTVQTLYWKDVGGAALQSASTTTASITYVPMGVWWSANIDVIPGSSNQDGFVGQLAGARMWSGVALTAKQLEAESRQIQPAMLRGLTAQWDFENDFGGRYFDKAGNGLNIAENLPAGAIRYVAGPQIPETRKYAVPMPQLSAAPQVAQAISSDEVFGLSPVTSQLFMYGIASSESFGASLAANLLSLYGVASAESIPSGSQSSLLAIPSISSDESVGIDSISTNASPPSIASDESFGPPLAAELLSLYGISSAESVGSGSVGQNASPPSIASDESVSLSMVSDTLFIAGIASAESVSIDSVGGSVLEIPGIASDESISISPAVTPPPPPPPPPIPPAPFPAPIAGAANNGSYYAELQRRWLRELYELRGGAPIVGPPKDDEDEDEDEDDETSSLAAPAPPVVIVEVEKIVYVPVRETVIVVESAPAPAPAPATSPVEPSPPLPATSPQPQEPSVHSTASLSAPPTPPPTPQALPVVSAPATTPALEIVVRVLGFGAGFVLGLATMRALMPLPPPPAPNPPLKLRRRRRRRRNR